MTGEMKQGELPKVIMHDKPIILYPDVAKRIEKRIDVWRKVWNGNRHTRVKLALLLVGEVKVKEDDAQIVVSDFFTLPGWSWSLIDVEASLASIEEIAKECMVVATMVAYAEGENLNPIDIGLMLAVDAAVGRPVPHIIVSSGNKTVMSFEKCEGISELLKSLKANLERKERIA